MTTDQIPDRTRPSTQGSGRRRAFRSKPWCAPVPPPPPSLLAPCPQPLPILLGRRRARCGASGPGRARWLLARLLHDGCCDDSPNEDGGCDGADDMLTAIKPERKEDDRAMTSTHTMSFVKFCAKYRPHPHFDQPSPRQCRYRNNICHRFAMFPHSVAALCPCQSAFLPACQPACLSVGRRVGRSVGLSSGGTSMHMPVCPSGCQLACCLCMYL